MGDSRIGGLTVPHRFTTYNEEEELALPRQHLEHQRSNEVTDSTPPPWLDAFNEQADEAGYLLINAATFGLGGWALDKFGFSNRVDKESSFFKAGEAVDTALSALSLGGVLKSGVKNLGRIWNGLSDLAVSTGKAVSKVGDLSLGKTLKGVKDFAKATLGTASRLDYRKTFFKAFPHLEGKVVVHHAIEQQVLRDFPHLLTKYELHSLENLRGIPKELNSNLHLKQIRQLWDEFYLDYPNPTRSDLLQKVKEIDDQFGHLFLPPVR